MVKSTSRGKHPQKAGKKKKNNENRPTDGVREPYDSVRAERAMWVAVITQAMMDALSKSAKPEEQFNKFEATRWLTGNSIQFRNVCSLAGLDPDYVRVRAKKALANGISWRAEAGTGKRYEERKAYRERTKIISPISLRPAQPPCMPPPPPNLMGLPQETFLA